MIQNFLKFVLLIYSKKRLYEIKSSKGNEIAVDKKSPWGISTMESNGRGVNKKIYVE